ncbi:30S ribosomal protein S18 [Patescibacteria group bacterium]|nr:30S ribosomal protein S18 [Patescibacteria group bacterium]
MANGFKKRQCYFCAENIKCIDYKDVNLLERYLSQYGKIVCKRRTGTCARHQRMLAKAMKRARHIALLPFVVR